MGNKPFATTPTAPLLQPSLDRDLGRIKEFVGQFLASYSLSSVEDPSGFPDSRLRNFVNRQDANGNTALHGAVFRGHRDVVETLFYYGASLEIKNDLGCSVTWLAAGYGHLDLMAYLLEERMEDDDLRRSALLTTNSSGDTPLLAAASRGHEDVCAKLFGIAKQLGIENDMNTRLNKSGDSPLSASLLSLEEPPSSLLTLLLNKSVINRFNVAGSTPLLITCERNWPNTVTALLKRGASPDLRDSKNGASPLAVAAFCGAVKTLELLLRSHKVLLDEPTTAGCTPLWLATRAGHVTCAKLLIDSGADPKIPDRTGVRPVDVAVKSNNRELVELLGRDS